MSKSLIKPVATMDAKPRYYKTFMNSS